MANHGQTKFSEPPPQYYGGEHGMQQGNPQSTAYTQPQPHGQPQAYGQPQPQAYGQPGQGQGQFSSVIVTHGAPTVVQPIPPRNYTVLGIFACLFCFFPTGLCAIYYANESSSALAQGDFARAHSSSRNARNLIIASVVVGIIGIVLVLVLRLAVYNTETTRYYYSSSY